LLVLDKSFALGVLGHENVLQMILGTILEDGRVLSDMVAVITRLVMSIDEDFTKKTVSCNTTSAKELKALFEPTCAHF
jgi:hypothetical protein